MDTPAEPSSRAHPVVELLANWVAGIIVYPILLIAALAAWWLAGDTVGLSLGAAVGATVLATFLGAPVYVALTRAAPGVSTRQAVIPVHIAIPAQVAARVASCTVAFVLVTGDVPGGAYVGAAVGLAATLVERLWDLLSPPSREPTPDEKEELRAEMRGISADIRARRERGPWYRRRRS